MLREECIPSLFGVVLSLVCLNAACMGIQSKPGVCTFVAITQQWWTRGAKSLLVDMLRFNSFPTNTRTRPEPAKITGFNTPTDVHNIVCVTRGDNLYIVDIVIIITKRDFFLLIT